MTEPGLLQSAVLNNVKWCASVCPGDPRADPADGIWLTAGTPMPLFPDVVTVRPGVSADRIARLTSGRASCSVKDSYADVDLRPYGFSELFSARWIGCDSPSLGDHPTGWLRITSRADLERWCTVAQLPEMLPAELLQSDNTRVLAKQDDRRLVAGVIVTLTDHAIGISNVFQATHGTRWVWGELAPTIGHHWPAVPIVGYEHGADLDAALFIGFSDLGPVRIWQRQPTL